MKNTPTLQTRRQFLGASVLGGALTWTVPSFLAHTFAALHAEAAEKATQVASGADSNILVILQMAGGNDGLNTLVPFANDHYAKGRVRLRLAAANVLKINEELGFHPSLEGFKSLYDGGHLAVIQGVGYPNPNRSHFRSTEIWQTASDAGNVEKYGWLGRYFDNACAGCDPTVGVNIGRQMPQAFAAKKPIGVSLDNPQNYRFISSDRPGPDETESSEEAFRKMTQLEDMDFGRDLNSGGSIGAVAGPAHHAGSPLDFLERTALDAQISSDKIRQVIRKVENMSVYPQGALANSLKLVARLIGGGLPTRVFYVSQGGYDTHTNQIGAHDRLLSELGGSLRAFVEDMKAQGNLSRVMVMTFSEFGRRVSENASGGTDHGAASLMFMAGGKVKAGMLGKYPSLAPRDLVNGDLQYHVDFRSVYAGVLEGWLNTPSAPILGRKFEPLVCI